MKRERAVERARVRKGAGVNQPSILTQFRKLAGSSNTRASNRPSKVTLVVTGQSNGSTSTTPVMGGCWRQDEHPMSKGGPEGEDISCGVTQEECQNMDNRAPGELTSLVPSQEPSRVASLAPAREPDRGGERSQLREPSQEDVCQDKEGQEHGQGARQGTKQ